MAKYCNIAFHQIEIYAPMRSMDSQSHRCYFTKVQVKLVRYKGKTVWISILKSTMQIVCDGEIYHTKIFSLQLPISITAFAPSHTLRLL